MKEGQNDFITSLREGHDHVRILIGEQFPGICGRSCMDCAYDYHVSCDTTISLAFSSLVGWDSVAVSLRCLWTRDLMLSFLELL